MASANERSRLTRVLHWVRGERVLAAVIAGTDPVPRPLATLDPAEQLASLLASTSVPHVERVKRLAPQETEEPMALLAAARSLRFYLPIPGGDGFELECSLLPDRGDLVPVHFEARLPSGERACTGELRYLLVPASVDHEREINARADLKRGLGYQGW